MLVVLHFHQLGYSPVQITALFLFYEIFGIVTNLFGGYLGARKGVGFFLGGALLALVWALSVILLQQDLGKAKNKPKFRELFSKSRAINIFDGKSAYVWAAVLTLVTVTLASALSTNLPIDVVLIRGLIIFGIVFAINSSLHSYLIVSYAKEDGVSLDVGFYYRANAMGRLIGTLLSGWIYQSAG